jgi:hypothetical protein
VIRLGVRLTLNGGKEAAVRLAVTAAAAALGVGLLLVALAGMNAINTQNARTAWLNTATFGNGPGAPGPGPSNLTPGPSTNPNATTSDPLWVLFSVDHFANQTIDRVDVAAAGAHSPIPPGITHLPGPGQFDASPALTRLFRSTPAGELADRFPGAQIATIGPSALPSPNSLIIIIGHRVAQLSNVQGAAPVTSINTATGHSGGQNGWDANRLQIILAVGALALLFPVLIFIATATRLAAARREQRFAAMRLVGATPRQVSVIAAVEASVAALVGVALGFGVFFLSRPAMTNIAFTGQTFAPGDLSLGLVDIVLVAIGVPLAAAAAARVALRRVVISPLGVTRRVTPAAPRAYRLVPLVAGVVELAYFVDVGRPKSTGGQIDAYFSGCLLIMIGLIYAGPWLTMVGARAMARRTNSPAALIAGRRMSDNPRGAFRAITGLILALFIGTVSVGITTTIHDDQGTAGGGTVANNTLVDQFGPLDNAGPPQIPVGQPQTATISLPDRLVATLVSIPHVQGVTVLHVASAPSQTDVGGPLTILASCAQLVHTPTIGRCAPGADVARLSGNLDRPATSTSTLATTDWSAVAVSPARLASLPVRAVVVAADGSRASIERARTTLEVAFPNQAPPLTLGEINSADTRSAAELQQLTKIVILVALVVAGCSLAVSVTAGVNDRKRSFSLLRLTGVPLRELRRVVGLETTVPLLVSAVLSAAMGFLAAGLFLRSQLGESLQYPGIGYYVIVIAGLVACLGIIATTLPLIERITGPDIARNE